MLVVAGRVKVPDAAAVATTVVVPDEEPVNTWPPVPAVNVVDVRAVSPEILVAVLPSATAVEPIVTLLLASCALGIALVPRTPVLLL